MCVCVCVCVCIRKRVTQSSVAGNFQFHANGFTGPNIFMHI